MTTADELALLAAVCADPDDDVVRLAYADYLEENAGVVPCPACLHTGSLATPSAHVKYGTRVAERAFELAKCGQCNGSGTAPDGRADRAELIRVQCEIAAISDPPPEPSVGMRSASREQRLAALREWKQQWQATYYALRQREGGLVKVLWPDSKMFVGGVQIYLPGFKPNESIGAGATTGTVRRGFIDSLTLSWEAFAGGECENCGGFGEFRRRHDNGDGPEGPCPDCGGKWNSGPHDSIDDYWDKGSGRTPGIHSSLIWWPGTVDVCPGCEGRGEVRFCDAAGDMDDTPCLDCGGSLAGGYKRGTGTAPRPVPPTAQPVTSVTITGEFPVDQGFVLATTLADAGRQTWFNPRWPTVTFTLPA
jgi:hypothetical protein